MMRRLIPFLPPFLFLAGLSLGAGPARANESGAPAEAAKPVQASVPADASPPGLRPIPIRKPAPPPPRLLAVDGAKGVENFCGAIASSAASARLAWQEQRIRTLEAQLSVKSAELDAKSAELRHWVEKREQLLAKASDSLVAIFAKMKPEAASAQMQAMDDDEAAALLARLKPSAASAVMAEMDPARAARLSDLLSARTDEKKS